MPNATKRAVRVLYVEDDKAARDGYIAYLTRSGYDVVAAGMGRDALTLATDCVPDVIVLDLGLPDIDGWEIARQLKADRQTSQIPIIALTGSDLPHERVSAMRAGCDRHLSKPCAPADVLKAIRKCVSKLT